MIRKHDLPDILYDSLKQLGGAATIVDVCKYVWTKYNMELERSGDLFYTWQYDIRWAATELRKTKKMRSSELSPKGVWELME
ncbi:MAG: hypothetical protein ACOX21_00380 [Bacillota bacterium]|jgi:hypothetical protein|nr:hypothetical protein [Bacillota bacterium]